MAKTTFMESYRKFYIDRDNEQLRLFQLLANVFSITRVLYPGSYIHITPSFIFQDVVYVDNDQATKKLFLEKELVRYVEMRSEYSCKPTIEFYPTSYTNSFDEPEGSFDLLVSLYAGFISMHCKNNLKSGGILLVNNSHGDAGIASLDIDFELIGVINRRANRFTLSDKKLDEYFIPKEGREISRDLLLNIMRGIGYKKTASLYLFKKK